MIFEKTWFGVSLSKDLNPRGQIQLPDDNRYFPGRANLQDHLSRYASNF